MIKQMNYCAYLHQILCEENAEIIILLENERAENLLSEFYFRILLFYSKSFYAFELKPLFNGLLIY